MKSKYGYIVIRRSVLVKQFLFDELCMSFYSNMLIDQGGKEKKKNEKKEKKEKKE